MSQLVRVDDPSRLRTAIHIRPGDVLWFSATGGRLDDDPSSDGCIEVIGSLCEGLLVETGELVAAAGPPTAFLVRALRPGRAKVEVFTGDPWRSSSAHVVEIVVV